MKKIIPALLLASLWVACSGPAKKASNGFIINGTIQGVKDNVPVLLQLYDNGTAKTLDSTVVKKGAFTMSGHIASPEVCYIIVGAKPHPIHFFLENATITVKANADSLDAAVVTGSATEDTYQDFQKGGDKYNNQLADMYGQYSQAQQAGDSAKMKAIDSAYEAVTKQYNGYIKSFVEGHHHSVVAPFLAIRFLANGMSPEGLDSLAQKMDSTALNSTYGKSFTDYVHTLQSVEVGKPAPDFTMKDTSGNPVSLSSFKGKYLLLDFWASWCHPCREENPNVVKAYKMFKDKGLNILGVSLDDNKAHWEAAIQHDSLTWTEVSDLQGWKNAAAKLYGVRAIPHSFLIGKDGKIIAQNLRGAGLEKKLAEVLK